MSTSQDSLKRAAAAKALDYVQDGMRLGLGTGSTADFFVELLALRAKQGQKFLCAPTSERTAQKARALGLTLAPLEDLAPLDVTIDGADEADRNLDLIKGGGGALLREKIVAASSKRMIVITDETKLVSRLGQFPLPVEVIEFGHGTTAARLQRTAEQLGYPPVKMTLRAKDGVVFKTDSGNVIYDCAFGAITNARKLADAFSAVTGVVEHGLFVGIATTLLIANPGEVEVIDKV